MGRCSAAAAVCTSALLLASAGAFGPDSHELWSDASPDAASAAAGGAPSPPPCMELSNAFGDHMVLQREPERAVVYGTVPALPPRPPAVLSALSIFHSKPISYGAFVTICTGANFYKRRALIHLSDPFGGFSPGQVCGRLAGAKTVSIAIDGGAPAVAVIKSTDKTWSVTLPPTAASLKPHTLKISGGARRGR